ncbi:hypothetical protein K6U06_12315 [Acidiferrimicrobium sp. IK]|uniref:hypothetical protein n=1 Tax=Acidiferrimicrobium sp. IK TaxID=2871700 RepID=UPI0021CB33FE|nr:hypothetical protein [Acidiferrimicrobium sp. IK]MCU4185149.1 hypothetical protein [Acidiferrimicrobium sp. IK]
MFKQSTRSHSRRELDPTGAYLGHLGAALDYRDWHRFAVLVIDDARPGTAAPRDVIANYKDQEIGVADASSVVLADRYRTRTIASLDHRHFDTLGSLDGGYFEVLPRVG